MSQYEYSKLHELYLSCYRIFDEDENLIAALKALLSSALLSVSGCENFWLISYYSKLHELYLSCYRIFDEDENLIAALKALLSSALLSVSGCENFWLISYKRGLNLKNSQIMQYYKPIHIHPYVAADILALQEYYIVDIAKDVYDNFIGPYNLCTFEIFCQIINELFSSSILDLSPYDNIIKPIFMKKLK